MLFFCVRLRCWVGVWFCVCLLFYDGGEEDGHGAECYIAAEEHELVDILLVEGNLGVDVRFIGAYSCDVGLGIG